MTTLVLVTGEQDGGIRHRYENIIKTLGLKPRVVYYQRKYPEFTMRADQVILIDTKYITHPMYYRLKVEAKRVGARVFDARVNASSLAQIIQDYAPLGRM